MSDETELRTVQKKGLMLKFKTFLWQIYFFLSSQFRVILKRLICLCWQCAISSRRKASRKLTPPGPSITSVWSWWTLLTGCSEPYSLICHSSGWFGRVLGGGNQQWEYLSSNKTGTFYTFKGALDNPAVFPSSNLQTPRLRVWFEMSCIDILCRGVNKEQWGWPSQRLVISAAGVISTWTACALSRLDYLPLHRWHPVQLFTAHLSCLWEFICPTIPMSSRLCVYKDGYWNSCG